MLVQDHRDRRIFERFEAPFPARVDTSSGAGELPVLLKDVSAEGLKFSTTQKVSMDEPVALWVDLPQAPVSLKGRVVWIKTLTPALCDVGVHFEGVDFKNVQKVYQFSLAA